MMQYNNRKQYIDDDAIDASAKAIAIAIIASIADDDAIQQQLLMKASIKHQYIESINKAKADDAIDDDESNKASIKHQYIESYKAIDAIKQYIESINKAIADDAIADAIKHQQKANSINIDDESNKASIKHQYIDDDASIADDDADDADDDAESSFHQLMMLSIKPALIKLSSSAIYTRLRLERLKAGLVRQAAFLTFLGQKNDLKMFGEEQLMKKEEKNKNI